MLWLQATGGRTWCAEVRKNVRLFLFFHSSTHLFCSNCSWHVPASSIRGIELEGRWAMQAGWAEEQQRGRPVGQLRSTNRPQRRRAKTTNWAVVAMNECRTSGDEPCTQKEKCKLALFLLFVQGCQFLTVYSGRAAEIPLNRDRGKTNDTIFANDAIITLF